MLGLNPYWTFILICVAAVVYICWEENRRRRHEDAPDYENLARLPVRLRIVEVKDDDVPEPTWPPARHVPFDWDRGPRNAA